MGGPGSGTWYRWKSTKTTLDEVHRLDVRWLQRHGYLQRWARGVLTWHRGEHDAGAIGVALEDGRLVVAYRLPGRIREIFGGSLAMDHQRHRRLSFTHASNELIRLCLLRRQDERLLLMFRRQRKHWPAFSFSLRFLIVIISDYR